jgi:hypothetical protein
LKRDVASRSGISLIFVPCWWDGTRGRYLYKVKRKEREHEKRKKKDRKGKERPLILH